ncbi:MAG: NAD-dependent epimerase/dehydratase family protein [Bradymonadales bacterium]
MLNKIMCSLKWNNSVDSGVASISQSVLKFKIERSYSKEGFKSMAKEQVLIFDANSGIGRALTLALPRKYQSQGFSHKLLFESTRGVKSIALDNAHDLAPALRTSEHIVFASEILDSQHEALCQNAYKNLVLDAYDACDDARCKSFIFLSSASVYGPHKRARDEASACRPKTASGALALQIEEELTRRSMLRKLKPTILRSARVFGAGVGGFNYAAFQLAAIVAAHQLPITVYDPKTAICLIDVKDLASVIVECIQQSPAKAARIYNVASTKRMTREEFFQDLANACGIKFSKTRNLYVNSTLKLGKKLFLGALSALSNYTLETRWAKLRTSNSLVDTPAPRWEDIKECLDLPELNCSKLAKHGMEAKRDIDEESCKKLLAELQSERRLPATSTPKHSEFGAQVVIKQRWEGEVWAPQKTEKRLQTVLEFQKASSHIPYFGGQSFLHGHISIEGVYKKIAFTGLKTYENSKESLGIAHTTLHLRAEYSENLRVVLKPCFPARQDRVHIEVLDSKDKVRYQGQIQLNTSLLAKLRRLRTAKFRFR